MKSLSVIIITMSKCEELKDFQAKIALTQTNMHPNHNTTASKIINISIGSNTACVRSTRQICESFSESKMFWLVVGVPNPRVYTHAA